MPCGGEPKYRYFAKNLVMRLCGSVLPQFIRRVNKNSGLLWSSSGKWCRSTSIYLSRIHIPSIYSNAWDMWRRDGWRATELPSGLHLNFNFCVKLRAVWAVRILCKRLRKHDKTHRILWSSKRYIWPFSSLPGWVHSGHPQWSSCRNRLDEQFIHAVTLKWSNNISNWY